MGVEAILLTSALVMAGTAAAGAGISAYASRQEGKAANAAAQAQAQQQERQAKLEIQRAEVAQIQGERETRRRYQQLSQDIGSMYTQFAGNGMDINNSGTVGKALTTTAKEAAYDVRTIEDNTRMNVWGHLANAQSYRNDARVSLFRGKTAKQAGTLKAWGDGVGGIGKTITTGLSTYNAGSQFASSMGWK